MSVSKIVIDVTELMGQSGQMKTLKDEYAAVFANVTSILNEMNSGWSENLSNNFDGKILTAQKGFAKVVEMLECGETVAKEAATNFEDVNNVMARTMTGGFASLFEGFDLGGFSSLVAGGLDFSKLKESWSNIDLSQDWEAVKDNLSSFTTADMYENLSNLEGDIFGTNYLGDAKNVFTAAGDIFSGDFNSDTIDAITGLVDTEAIGELLGFSDATGIGIIIEGGKRIVGDGETLESIDPNMVNLALDYENKIAPAWENGNYFEAGVAATFYSLEASSKMVVDIGVDSLKTLGEGFLDVTGLDEAVPWSDINDSITEYTGIDFTEAIPAIAEGMSEEFGKRVDETVEGIPIIIDYIGDSIEHDIEYLGDAFSKAGSAIGDFLGF